GKYRRRRNLSFAEGRALERDPFPAGQRKCARRIPKLAGATGVSAFQFGFSRYSTRAVPHSSPISPRPAVDVPGGRLYRGPARNWILAPRSAIKCCGGGSSRFFYELPGPAFPRARRRRPRLSLDRGLDTKSPFHCDRPLSVLSSRFQPRSARLYSFHRATYSCAMNPLSDEW